MTHDEIHVSFLAYLVLWFVVVAVVRCRCFRCRRRLLALAIEIGNRYSRLVITANETGVKDLSLFLAVVTAMVRDGVIVVGVLIVSAATNLLFLLFGLRFSSVRLRDRTLMME